MACAMGWGRLRVCEPRRGDENLTTLLPKVRIIRTQPVAPKQRFELFLERLSSVVFLLSRDISLDPPSVR